MGNVEQNFISAYPSKIYSSTLKVPLNIGRFFQNHDFVEVAFSGDMRFWLK